MRERAVGSAHRHGPGGWRWCGIWQELLRGRCASAAARRCRGVAARWIAGDGLQMLGPCRPCRHTHICVQVQASVEVEEHVACDITALHARGVGHVCRQKPRKFLSYHAEYRISIPHALNPARIMRLCFGGRREQRWWRWWRRPFTDISATQHVCEPVIVSARRLEPIVVLNIHAPDRSPTSPHESLSLVWQLLRAVQPLQT